MINPFNLAKVIEKEVCRNGCKKFYRFRKTHFYGGCATADCLGCNLRCAYCWAQKKVWNPERYGEFYTTNEVSQNLDKMNYSIVRVSGGEPTICKEFLLDLISSIPENKLFILETNGILLDEDYVKELSNFTNLYVRVSLKGVDEGTFERITSAEGKFFHYQLEVLHFLRKYKIRHKAAILCDLFTNNQISKLEIADLEFETLIEYPFVTNNLDKRGIKVVKR